jgi:phosphonate dehydrogenase
LLKSSRVVVTHWVHPEVVQYLSTFAEVVPNTSRDTLPRNEIIRRAEDADALMVFMPDCIDEQFLDACRKLRIVSGALKGYDNFDVASCSKRGIWFSIVPDLLTVPTAELAIGLMIGLARNMLEGDRFVRAGAFAGWRPKMYGAGLAGSYVGIVGMGSLGKAVAKRLSAFESRLLYYDAVPLSPDEEQQLSVVSLSFHDLLAISDFLVLAVPLNADTLGLVDAAALACMKPGSYLINPARGSVVDEKAVEDSLVSGHLGGYAADVFEMEDWARADRLSRISEKLLDLSDRTFFTPHLGSAVEAARREIAMEAARNIVDALHGKRPRAAINDPIALH